MKGQLIVVEGLDGAGKTGLIKRMNQHLSDSAVDTLLTAEPGGTGIGLMLRKGLREGFAGIDEELDGTTEMLLFQAARSHHVNYLIKPALNAGNVVLCDRYYQTTLAYQGAGRGQSVEMLKTLQREVIGLEPDKIILLDGRPELFLNRMEVRQSSGEEKMNRLDNLGLAFYQRARQQYLDMADQDPDKYVVVNAEVNQDQVWAQVLPWLQEFTNHVKPRPRATQIVAGFVGNTGIKDYSVSK